jgi:multimeric flavodoxin WrbA
MKVIGINGSPRAEGNTATVLKEMAAELAREGIEMEILQVGNRLVRGCQACAACTRNKNERCIVTDDIVNEAVQKMKAADGIVLGSPVYFAGIGGTMKCFCDRVFYVSNTNGGLFAGKVGASVVAVRRSGGSATWQGLNFYLAISKMTLAGSSYWNIVHGTNPGEAALDGEGMQTVRNTAKNMAWLLRQKNSSGEATLPEYDRGTQTNFIR